MTPELEFAALADMIDAAERTMAYAVGSDVSSLPFDQMRADAILRVIGVLGEAAGRLSDGTRERFPALPWREMRGMRNVIIHRYDHVAWEIVWDTATVHIPAMMDSLRAAHAQLATELPPPPAEGPSA